MIWIKRCDTDALEFLLLNIPTLLKEKNKIDCADNGGEVKSLRSVPACQSYRTYLYVRNTYKLCVGSIILCTRPACFIRTSRSFQNFTARWTHSELFGKTKQEAAVGVGIWYSLAKVRVSS